MNYLEQESAGSRRLTWLGVAVVFHILLGYALVNGLARKVVEVIKQPLNAKLIEEVQPDKKPPPPPPPPPKLAVPPPPFIPPPEIQVANPPPVSNTISVSTDVRPAVPVPIGQTAPRVGPARVAPVISASSCDKPTYPPQSLRAQEQGSVLLSFLIDTEGHVQDSRVVRSSGYRRLDEAARRGLSLCKFRPGTVDGKPEQSWHQMEYVWKLED